jgi:hypothetical protein
MVVGLLEQTLLVHEFDAPDEVPVVFVLYPHLEIIVDALVGHQFQLVVAQVAQFVGCSV